jgi:two-component system response regulator RegA
MMNRPESDFQSISEVADDAFVPTTRLVSIPAENRRRRRILLLDDNDAFRESLARHFRQLERTVCAATCFPQACALLAAEDPGVVVTELKIGSTLVFPFLDALRRQDRTVVIATAYPSVATAVRAIRLGAAAYLAKPTTAQQILEETDRPRAGVDRESGDAVEWPSLDRTIWEYLNQVFVAAGSMSAAARRLGLDRRSLRRMLSKYPPTR